MISHTTTDIAGSWVLHEFCAVEGCLKFSTASGLDAAGKDQVRELWRDAYLCADHKHLACGLTTSDGFVCSRLKGHDGDHAGQNVIEATLGRWK